MKLGCYLLGAFLLLTASCKQRTGSDVKAPVPKQVKLHVLKPNEVAKFLAKLKGRYIYTPTASDTGSAVTKYFTCFNENEFLSEDAAEKHCKENKKNGETFSECVDRLMVSLLFRLSSEYEDAQATMRSKENPDKIVLNRTPEYKVKNDPNAGAEATLRYGRLKSDGLVHFFVLQFALPANEKNEVFVKGVFKQYDFSEEGKLKIKNREFVGAETFDFDVIKKATESDEAAFSELEKKFTESATVIVDKGFERDESVSF